MLNLDSEDESEVYIGCAGGADITAFKDDVYVVGKGTCYEVAVKGLVGGHSGVDIDKGIASAIKVLGAYLVDHEVTQLASMYAGERRNSIPANAVAIVRSESVLTSKGDVSVRELNETPKVLKEGQKMIDLIASLPKENVKLIIIEHMSTLKIPAAIGEFKTVKSKKFGNTTLTYMDWE